jgi:TDG/mug DNA glycosylase family protein
MDRRCCIRRWIPKSGISCCSKAFDRGEETVIQKLADRVRPPVRVLFVGINPGIRSAAIGHHFAGYSNRFWKLLHESRLVPEPIGTEDDVRLADWGFGLTNLIPRATPGIDSLRPDEYVAGTRELRRKVRRWGPQVVAFVGVTLYRIVFARRAADPIGLGIQDGAFEGARVFVLPNPSGRNANFSYQEMLAAFRGLRTWLRRTPVRRGVRL